jgi:D-arabinose 1-dehydrogenase-like Zn-dependent alcohol dehydrogenase
MKVRALSVDPGSGSLVPSTIAIGDPREDEVLVRVTHCGLCRSDLTKDSKLQRQSHSPLIAGHEIVGEVVQTCRDDRT